MALDYDAGMGQHHNPIDPRDPLSPALYFTLIDNGESGGPGGGRRPTDNGCGCATILIVLAIALIISLLTWR